MIAMQSNGGDPVAGLIPIAIIVFLGLLSLFIYFLPALLAWNGGHQQKTAIFVLNLFTGWTFIGWVVAMVWAFIESKPQPQPQVYYVQQPPQQYPPQPSGPYNAPPPDYNYRKFNQ